MALVTEGAGGTATRVFGRVRSAGIRSGGKTGTAEKLTPLYDKDTGKLKTITKKRRNKDGEWEEYKVPQTYERIDSWYLSIAPLENPQLAIAVVVEGGGYGATVAAPIAANIILRARDLGLLGSKYTPRRPLNEPKPKSPKKRNN
jgi:cell division protein FtsI/penicillin-binding protein 2